MILRDGAVLLGSFLVGTLLAGAFGATNLGTALTFGTIAFLVAVLALMLLPKDR
jgi:hypothetical protein